jgi:hypothetical protein
VDNRVVDQQVGADTDDDEDIDDDIIVFNPFGVSHCASPAPIDDILKANFGYMRGLDTENDKQISWESLDRDFMVGGASISGAPVFEQSKAFVPSQMILQGTVPVKPPPGFHHVLPSQTVSSEETDDVESFEVPEPPPPTRGPPAIPGNSSSSFSLLAPLQESYFPETKNPFFRSL